MPRRIDKCPLCAGANDERLNATDSAGREWSIARCSACGVGVLAPMLVGSELDSYYGEDFYGPEHKRFAGATEGMIPMFRRARAARVARLLPSGGSILDVGCGRGIMLAELAKGGYRCFGTERSNDAAAAARAFGVTVYPSDIGELPIEKGSLDAVTYWQVLEHLDDPAASVNAAAALLKKGGRMLIQVPNFGGWQSRAFGAKWFHLDPPRHLWHFNTKALDGIMANAGMAREKVGFASFEYDPFGWAQSAMNALGMERDLLYRLMMSGGTESVGASPMSRYAAWLGGALLLGPSMALFGLSVAFRAGAVIEAVYAKK